MKEIYTGNLSGIPEGGMCAQTDPEIFFPEKGGSTREARRICNTICEVKEECLEGALERKEKFGIWGGLTHTELRALGKRAQAAS